MGAPPDRHYLPVLYLDSGDIVEVQAATGIEVGRASISWKRWLVRVAADDQWAMDLLPFDDSLTHVSSVTRVLCMAWYVADPGELNNLIDKPQYAAARRKLAARLHAYFDRVAEPKWDLWKGGTSKTGPMIKGLFDNPGPAPPPKRAVEGRR